MDKIELSEKTKDELIDIILEQEESAWYGMAIAQDIAIAKNLVDKKYERLIKFVGFESAILMSTIIALMIIIIKGVLK